MRLFAKFFSYLFHPVILSLILPFLIINKLRDNPFYALKWTVFSSLFVLAMLFLILFGMRKGAFSDTDISKKDERYSFYEILYFLVFLYFATAVILKGIFFPLSIIAFGVLIGIVIFNFANYFLKASVHTAVACAYVSTVMLLYGKPGFLLTFWIIPIVIWARIYLKHHTFLETIAGGAIGAAITLLTFLIAKIFI